MSVAMTGALELAQGRARVNLRPAGSVVYVDVDTVRSGWRLFRAVRSQPAVLRFTRAFAEAANVSFVARFRGKALFRIPNTKTHQPTNVERKQTMANETKETKNWPDLAEGLYDKLTGRGAQINYQFENLEVAVPSSTGGNASQANWKLNGAIRISTQEKKA